jgi:hypothetical protein
MQIRVEQRRIKRLSDHHPDRKNKNSRIVCCFIAERKAQ